MRDKDKMFSAKPEEVVPQAIRPAEMITQFDLAVVINVVCQQTIEPTREGRVPKRIFNKIRPLLKGKPRLDYDALEIGDNDRLVVKSIGSFDSDTLAEFEFVSSSRAIPKVSSISFVFRNFADFKREEALDLIWLNIPFGFVLKADQVPDEAISKALKSSQAQCFLELPADMISWEVILNGHRLLKNIPDNELSDSNLRAILETFPVLDAIYFHIGDDIDRDLVRLIIGLADNLRLTYLLSDDNPDFADSLAYLKGLKIKSMPDIDKDISLAGNDLRSLIISRTNRFRQSDKGSYFVPSRFDEVENLKIFLPLFERLNIVITPPLRLAPIIEKL